jgi:ribonucleoside-diphosphate reductase alpha subunit
MAQNQMENNMQVVKRDGRREDVAFEKVQQRIVKQSEGLNVNAVKVAQGVLARIVDGITTTELDNIAANLAYSWSTTHPDYAVLAGRIALSNHQRNTPSRFVDVIERLVAVKDRAGNPASMLDPEFVRVIRENAEQIEARIDYGRDFLIDYFGFKTLEKAYLLRDTERRIVERPQHMWMRVSIGLWVNDLEKAFETYDMMSQKLYTHATPTLFNAGTKRPQLSSCFLLSMNDDSIRGIYKTLEDCALISQYGGGIGIHCSNIRAKGSLIRGTGGISNGLVPMLRVFNNTARYVDQCFAPDTIVYTNNGPKRIADLDSSDKVLTSGASEIVDVDGKHGFLEKGPAYNQVIKLVEHEYKGEILNIRVSYESNTSNIHVTCSHPVFAFQKRHGSTMTPEYLLENGNANLDYIEIGKLSPGDWIAHPAQEGVGKYKGFNFSVIESMTSSHYEGKLYDLEVDGTHDYLVSGLGIAHNGGGKRNGSFAMYLEPWHADIQEFLELKKNTGAEEERARDLFYALWVPDLFMERVDANGDWTLFCPNEAPGLADVVGDEFKALYEKYEAEGRGRRTIKAQKLWFQILDSQIETGTPYLCYKDAANKKSNQQNLGVIKSSNLCSEIIEYSSPDETAVCNLASMSLPAFVKDGAFDFKQFRATVRVAVRNLNRVIDINYYPTPEAQRSNMRHRPIGLGVQGLADVFAMLRLPWESDEAAKLNKRIFAHMYYAALESSCDLAAKEGPYETYIGSPASMGKFQPHLWNIDPLEDEGLDWDTLFHHISRIGLRNSLLVSPMPTASTSQILGNCECIEPYATHIFTRRTLAGEFIILNKHLVTALIERGIWSAEVKDAIIANNGSVAGLPMIPADLQAIFKTVWEMKQKTLIDMAADRGPYVCQSQSLNLFMGDPDYRKLTSMHFYTWRRGLKTGIYYLRTRAAASAQKFTVEPVHTVGATPSVKEEEGCLMCSS